MTVTEKSEEFALCIPAAPFRSWFENEAKGYDPNYVQFEDGRLLGEGEGDEMLAFFGRFITAAAGATFLPRSECERDPRWKQIVPYITLHCGGSTFRYERPAAGGEPRLDGRWSIGIGGHLNPDDFRNESIDRQGVEAGAWRELNEEVTLHSPPRSFNLMGVVNYDGDEVGLHHLGLHYACVLWSPNVASSLEIHAPSWKPTPSLRKLAAFGPGGDAEPWTKIVSRRL